MSPEIKSSIDKKLKKLESVIEHLEELRTSRWEDFIEEFKIQDSAMYNLVVGIEAVTDVGNYLLSEHFNKSPETYEDIIKELGATKIISEDLLKKSKGMAGFRNLLVHVYETVEPEKVYQYLQQAPGIFRQYAKAFSEFLDKD
jgi:uncharacterized protein YutE (UPF0331/DUF86 family)